MADTTVIDRFLKQAEEIKKEGITLVFRSPSNIKGLHVFIEHIKSRKITYDDLNNFLDDNPEIKNDGELGKSVKDFLEYNDEDDKTIQNLYKFLYKQKKTNIKGLHEYIYLRKIKYNELNNL